MTISNRSHDVMIDSEFLKMLRCPETRQTLALAEPVALRALNDRIQAGQVRTRGGTKVEQACEAGLVREDRHYLYPIRDGIPVLLIAESIAWEKPA